MDWLACQRQQFHSWACPAIRSKPNQIKSPGAEYQEHVADVLTVPVNQPCAPKGHFCRLQDFPLALF